MLAQTIGRRFPRTLGNSDIAFWLISQRILPPIAIAIPLYVLFQQVGLLDSLAALVITYVAANLPIVVWLMRDYFASLPRELEESAAVDGASVYRIVALDRAADLGPGPRRDVPHRAHLRLERVPHRPRPDQRRTRRRCRSRSRPRMRPAARSGGRCPF